MIGFTEEGHKYYSLDGSNKEWISVTTLIHALCEPFNQIEKAQKCSVRKPGRYPNKWYGYTPQEIMQAWDSESNRSTELGHWYHSKQEHKLYESGDTRVVPPIVSNGSKVVYSQKLSDGIYPEHIVYLESAGICGQVDRPEVVLDVLNINDYKTNKEIKRQGFTDWEGNRKKMLHPQQHLDDCELSHYSLQLSLYMYMILSHNPILRSGKLTIEHVKFETIGEDKYGYPITKLDDNKEPIVREIEYIECKYMKSEVVALINWLKIPDNRTKVLSSKK